MELGGAEENIEEIARALSVKKEDLRNSLSCPERVPAIQGDRLGKIKPSSMARKNQKKPRNTDPHFSEPDFLKSCDIKITPEGIALIQHDTHFTAWVEAAGRLDHDTGTLELISKHINPRKNIIDVGANIGTHTYFYQGKTSGTVYAFEPNPLAFKCLQHNCKGSINLPVGLSDKACILPYHSSSNAGAGHFTDPSLESLSAWKKVALRMTNQNSKDYLSLVSLDSMLIRDVGFIKMDIEGFEVSALQGASQTIFACKPNIYLEVSPDYLARAGSSVIDLIKVLKSFNYVPLWGIGEPIQSDIMFVPRRRYRAELSASSSINGVKFFNHKGRPSWIGFREHFSSYLP